jgi:hypothetical protein
MTEPSRLGEFPFYPQWMQAIKAGLVKGVDFNADVDLWTMALVQIKAAARNKEVAGGLYDYPLALWPHPALSALRCHYIFERENQARHNEAVKDLPGRERAAYRSVASQDETYRLHWGWWATLACEYYLANPVNYPAWLAERQANIVYVKVKGE